MAIDWFPLELSLRVALLATAVVLVAGVACAWLLERRRFPGSELVDAVITLPLVLPPSVLGYYLLVLLGSQSPIGRGLESVFGIRLVFTWQGAVVAACVGALPLVIKTVRSGFSSVDLTLEDAARTLGKSEWLVFWRVTLPLASRAIFAAGMLAFARALGDFGATLMVAGNIPHRTQTAAIAIYDATESGRERDALIMVLVLSAVAFASLYATNRMASRRAGS